MSKELTTTNGELTYHTLRVVFGAIDSTDSRFRGMVLIPYDAICFYVYPRRPPVGETFWHVCTSEIEVLQARELSADAIYHREKVNTTQELLEYMIWRTHRKGIDKTQQEIKSALGL